MHNLPFLKIKKLISQLNTYQIYLQVYTKKYIRFLIKIDLEMLVRSKENA